VPAANNIPQPNSQLSERNAEELLKTPSIIPGPVAPESESDADRSDSDGLKDQQEPPKRQRSMLIPTNWTPNARLIPTEIDARFNVIRASLDEPAPESVAAPNAPATARSKARALQGRGAGKVNRTVYTQPQNPRPVAQTKSRANDPAFIGVFVPLVGVNAPLGVVRAGQKAVAVPARSLKPTAAEMLSAQTPLRSAVPKLRAGPPAVKAAPTKPQPARSVTPKDSKPDQE
jgi:hypothetical protein